MQFCSRPTSRTLSIVPLPMVLGFGNLAHNAVDTVTHLKHRIHASLGDFQYVPRGVVPSQKYAHTRVQRNAYSFISAWNWNGLCASGGDTCEVLVGSCLDNRRIAF
jgi:hypothetical protein